jgi:hypothetical protein
MIDLASKSRIKPTTRRRNDKAAAVASSRLIRIAGPGIANGACCRGAMILFK